MRPFGAAQACQEAPEQWHSVTIAVSKSLATSNSAAIAASDSLFSILLVTVLAMPARLPRRQDLQQVFRDDICARSCISALILPSFPKRFCLCQHVLQLEHWCSRRANRSRLPRPRVLQPRCLSRPRLFQQVIIPPFRFLNLPSCDPALA